MTVQTPDIDQVALEAARQLTADNDPQSRSAMQCAIIAAIQRERHAELEAVRLPDELVCLGQNLRSLAALTKQFATDADGITVIANMQCEIKHAQGLLKAALAATGKQQVGEESPGQPENCGSGAKAQVDQVGEVQGTAKGRAASNDWQPMGTAPRNRFIELRGRIDTTRPKEQVYKACFNHHFGCYTTPKGNQVAATAWREVAP